MISRIAASVLGANCLGLALVVTSIGSAKAAQTARWTCAQNERHLVVQRDNPEGLGDLLTVRRVLREKTPPCSLQALPGDYDANPNKDPLYLIALKDDFLILSESTGPQGQVLIVDLPERKTILKAGFSTGECDPTRFQCQDFTISEQGLTFWRTTAEKVGAKNCPSLKGIRKLDLTPTIEQQATFDFATKRLVGQAERRCVAYQ